jgi:uncharacterized protein YjbI with pentapeptide repeats
MTPGQQLALAAVAALAAAGAAKKRSGSAAFRLPQSQKRKLVRLFSSDDKVLQQQALELAGTLGGVDFSNVRFPDRFYIDKLDLSGANMAGITMKIGNIRDSNIDNADFGGANLNQTELVLDQGRKPGVDEDDGGRFRAVGTNFSRALLTHSYVSAYFEGCDFSGARFKKSELQATFNYCALDGADFGGLEPEGFSDIQITLNPPSYSKDDAKVARTGMRNVVFRSSKIKDLKIDGKDGWSFDDRSGAVAFRCDFSKVKVDQVYFDGVDFIECDFTGLQADRLVAYGCRFERCIFSGSFVESLINSSSTGMDFGTKS